jgi:hypothetical protein
VGEGHPRREDSTVVIMAAHSVLTRRRGSDSNPRYGCPHAAGSRSFS